MDLEASPYGSASYRGSEPYGYRQDDEKQLLALKIVWGNLRGEPTKLCKTSANEPLSYFESAQLENLKDAAKRLIASTNLAPEAIADVRRVSEEINDLQMRVRQREEWHDKLRDSNPTTQLKILLVNQRMRDSTEHKKW